MSPTSPNTKMPQTTPFIKKKIPKINKATKMEQKKQPYTHQRLKRGSLGFSRNLNGLVQLLEMLDYTSNLNKL